VNIQIFSRRKIESRSILYLIIPLILSTYTHLWNPTGFPSIHVDEGHYLRKAISTEEGKGFQPQNRYLAPYFAQIFLAGVFKIIGFPYFLNLNQDSVQDLYLVPRLIMGVLAVIDTLLVYKIAENRYGRNVALIASVLFAVMPVGWMTRRILLESIQLPFILTSILLALYIGNHKGNLKLSIVMSGIFLGLAIFTKIPAFTLIPLIGAVIFFNTRKLKFVVLWLIPVILIPSLWPIHAASIGDFKEWVHGIQYQTNRESRPLINALNTFFQIDPILFSLGMIGLLYSIIKRDYFLITWVLSLLIFLQLIGYVASFHIISLLPPFCLLGARLLNGIGSNLRIAGKSDVLPMVRLAAISIFGIISISMLISIDLNSTYYKALGFIVKELPSSNVSSTKANDQKVTLVGNPQYFWVPEFVFQRSFDDKSYYSSSSFDSKNYLMIMDKGFLDRLTDKTGHWQRFAIAYNATHSIAKYEQNLTGNIDTTKYPFTNLKLTPETKYVDIRSNY
jgi:hypothetical protein